MTYRDLSPDEIMRAGDELWNVDKWITITKGSLADGKSLLDTWGPRGAHVRRQVIPAGAPVRKICSLGDCPVSGECSKREWVCKCRQLKSYEGDKCYWCGEPEPGRAVVQSGRMATTVTLSMPPRDVPALSQKVRDLLRLAADLKSRP